jgi:pimeloyl-ACP methyl ester carboxylesterase
MDPFLRQFRRPDRYKPLMSKGLDRAKGPALGSANAALFEAKVDVPAWKTKPSWYVVAQKDETINTEQERFMSKRMGATTIEVDSSHVPMLSHPDVVADLIMKASDASAR